MPSNNRPHVSRVEMDLAGRTLSFETGLVAQQADGAVVVRYGDSTVLTTRRRRARAECIRWLLPTHCRL